MQNKASDKLAVVLKGIWGTLVFCLIVMGSASGQDELNVIRGESSNNNWIQFTDAHNALYRHLSEEAYDLLDKRSAYISDLQTLADWRERQQQVRAILEEITGPFSPKTPLNARVTRILEKDDYRVEHIVYESQPEFYVTSSLFIPRKLTGKAPAVLYLSGHTEEGYRSETYQHKMLNLVKKGFIVLAIDPVGQGERKQYYDVSAGGSVVGSATREHSYVGTQAFISGSSLARYMIWDGIRAVDYLLSREEVDPGRIGITGRSGGGTQTAYIAAFDERIHAAAPEAYITSFRRLLQSIGPQDAEQNFYHGISAGLDHADLLEVRAPRPTLMITTTEDFFSIQGARETAREVSKVYDAYETPGHFNMVEDGGGHTSTRANREAMYAFFQEHLDNPGDPTDQAVEILGEEEMRVTETGQVITSLGGETVFSLNRREARQKIQELRASRKNIETHLPMVLESARELSGYQVPGKIAEPVFTGRISRDGYEIEKYFTRGEGGYPVPYLLMKPDNSNGKVVLYLHPDGKAGGTTPMEEMEWFVQRGFTVLAPDLVGTGETGPGDLANYVTRVKDFDPVSYDVWTNSVLIGRSITGIRAGDVVRLVRLLEQQVNPREVYGVARDDMAPVLLHAAAFEPALNRVALIEPYHSYWSLVRQKFYDPTYHISAVPGALETYDLPDLAAALAPRKLLIAGITDGAGEMLKNVSADEDLSFVKNVYKQKRADEHLTIFPDTGDELEQLFVEWTKETSAE
ncbi:acetylxylan esterase [Halalkalibaculum sp. DA384]|uniref:acetylxylan esterase n=1 Tax=Halalkalibaculum sp. DA384 TaxID=3373606 RepID=UPI0037545548